MLNTRLVRWGMVAWLSLLPALGHAESPAPSLPPDAQQAFDRGLAAVKQQEWKLGIQQFREALHRAPDAPEVLFNLALAYDKLGGRDLETIAWFRAYLAAAPNAANTAQVHQRIHELERSVEATVHLLLAKALEVAAALPMDTNGDWKDKLFAYQVVAETQAACHDMPGARQTFEVMRQMIAGHRVPGDILNDILKTEAYQALAESQRRAGDIEGITETLSVIKGDAFEREQNRQDTLHAIEAMSAQAPAKLSDGNRSVSLNQIFPLDQWTCADGNAHAVRMAVLSQDRDLARAESVFWHTMADACTWNDILGPHTGPDIDDAQGYVAFYRQIGNQYPNLAHYAPWDLAKAAYALTTGLQTLNALDDEWQQHRTSVSP